MVTSIFLLFEYSVYNLTKSDTYSNIIGFTSMFFCFVYLICGIMFFKSFFEFFTKD